MVAAVQSGADAIYLGAGDFNARRNADNFGGELDAAVGYCHARNVRAYVTLNTMVRQDELGRLEKTIGEICDAGADAVIVQDFGVARAVRQMAPSLHLHASTQMAVHNRQGVEFLIRNGFSRVVLAREMEYAEIARCAQTGADLEVFVHGALCVSCSGQCLMSSLIGGRSGNRGLCAQPCRMRYRMAQHEGYLLSTKDLCSLERLPELVRAGTGSLKIEGRLKRPEYVALTTSIYREALDAACSGRDFDVAYAKRELAQMFNRGGFTRGYGPGVEDRELMFAQRPNHLGVEIGRCTKNGQVQLDAETDAADALVLRRGSEDVPVHPGILTPPAASMSEAHKGDKLVRLVSQKQMQGLKDRYFGEFLNIPIDMQLKLRVGEAAEMRVWDGVHEVVHSGAIVEEAKSRPADPERIRAQVGKLGDTPFAIREYAAEIDEMAYLPVSALNALRRESIEKLFEKRMGMPHVHGAMEIPRAEPVRNIPALIAQSGNPDQLKAALKAGADRIVFAPEDLRTGALEEALVSLPEQFELALPPVAAEGSLDTLNAWALRNETRITHTWISNIGQMQLTWPGRKVGDTSLNIANTLSAAQLSDWEIAAYAPSIELNRAQIEALGGEKYLTVYGSIVLMHLRHCPLRAAEKLPGLHRDCRRCDACAPEKHISNLALTDRMNASFPLKRIATDDGCIIQLMNSAKLMLLRKSASLPACSGWRILLDENDDVEKIVRLHRIQLDGGDARRDDAWPDIEKQNTTTGHYFRGTE